jgi:hydrogenase maturation protease
MSYPGCRSTGPGVKQASGRPTLVLGVGNPLQGDDGLGIRAVQMLAERDIPPGVTVEDAGTPGLGLAAWLDGWSSVILVDAVHMGETPGNWRRFGLGEIRLIVENSPLSLHEPGLSSGLALAQALDVLPEDILLYGVEPEVLDNGQELSPTIKRALPELVEDILDELWMRNQKPKSVS